MHVRRIGAGFLAGASSVASLLLLIAALVLVAGIFGLIRDISTGVFGDIPVSAALAQSLGDSFRTLPQYFWSARWGMVALGIIGVVLALADWLRPRFNRPWRDSLGYIVTNGIVAVVVIGTLYANNAALYQMIAEQPTLFNQQAMLLVSDWTILGIGSLVTLGIAYIVWAAWQWWYTPWARGLRVERPPMLESTVESTAPTASSDDWRAYQDRLMRLKRQEQSGEAPVTSAPVARTQRSWLPILAGTLVVASIIMLVLLRVYHSSAADLVSGEFWLDTNAPRTAVGIYFGNTPRSITFSNNSGVGTVDIRIGNNTQTLKTLDGMALAGGPGVRSEILNLDGLQPGSYRIDADLREGTGGLMRYVGLYGGGWQAQIAALAIGLMSGVWVVSAHLLLLELLAQRGRSR